MGAVAYASTELFTDRVSQFLSQVDYRLAEFDDEREEIFRLRYKAYRREEAISPNIQRQFSDPYDEKGNVRIFGLYIGDTLASSIRIHVANRESPIFPSYSVFSDLLESEIEAGKTIIDPTRFVTDKTMSRIHSGLPHVTLRLCWLAAQHFDADHFLVAIRPEHQAFYRRFFGHRAICGARAYPLLATPISLMTVNHAEVASYVHRRYPFFRSTYFERRMLFDGVTQLHRYAQPRTANLRVVDTYGADVSSQ